MTCLIQDIVVNTLKGALMKTNESSCLVLLTINNEKGLLYKMLNLDIMIYCVFVSDDSGTNIEAIFTIKRQLFSDVKLT